MHVHEARGREPELGSRLPMLRVMCTNHSDIGIFPWRSVQGARSTEDSRRTATSSILIFYIAKTRTVWVLKSIQREQI